MIVSRKIVLQRSIRTVLALAAMSVMGVAALAATQSPPAPSTVTKETREKMAVLHEQMAACLRSDKPLADCRAEMMKSCKESMGDQGCPMTGMGMGNGMGMGKHSNAPK
jgi:hypothetical protein